MTAYYNENDPQAAAWLRELIAANLIAPGDVDVRSICDVAPSDLEGYTQCHFFAGIGGWSYALRLAGWPDDQPVWTGSCPCQPFSTAGKGLGVDDERHLWPEFHRLIDKRRPAVCFGEQVASAAGRQWLSGVRADLEGLAYVVGAADLCAASVGAPHIRQRLFWVADHDGGGCEQGGQPGELGEVPGEPTIVGMPASERGSYRRVVDTDSARPQGRGVVGDGADERPTRSAGVDAWRGHGWVQCSDGRQRPVAPIARRVDDGVSARVGLLRGYGNAIVPQVAAEFVGAWLDVVDSALEQG